MFKKSLWQATRAYSFPASIVPVLLGNALASSGYAGVRTFHLWIFIVTLIGALLAHAGANVFNDIFDYKLGVDSRPEHGSGVLPGGLLSLGQMVIFGIFLFTGAGICAVALLPRHAAIIVPLAILGLSCAILYPALLKRYGLGDLLIILSFGIGLTAGSYGVQEGIMNAHQWELVSLLSLPVCLLVDAILHANNLRDRDDDRAAGVRTLATLLSPSGRLRLQQALLFGPVILAIIGVASHLLPVWSLATVLALPALISAYKSGSVPGTAQAHLLFGLLYMLAFIPNMWVH
jgi:1,4-dihydroxy-2-naphthoate octaprenyltransferase